jgi:copper transport protein
VPDRERPGHPDRTRRPGPARAAGGLTVRRVALAGALGLALALAPVTALAHASLIAADPTPGAVLPAAPAAITLRFSEGVTPAGPGISVVAPSGRPLATGPVRVAGTAMSAAFRSAGDGTYLVTWQVIASDTHPSRGQLTFSVGHPSPVPAGDALSTDIGAVSPAGLLLQTLGRWLHLAGMALAFGVVAFRVAVLPDATAAQAGRLDRLLGAGVALLVIAEPAALAGEAVSLGVVAGDLVASSFGRVLALRLGGALLLWSALSAVREAGRGRTALLALGAVLALVDALAGHRIAGWPDAAALVLSATHEGAMAVWAGGLAAVLVTRAGAARFGRLAIGSFAVLVVSGALLAVAHLRGPGDLVSTTYGSVLAVKVVAVGAAAAIAGLGARRVEAAALAGVAALAALLVSLPPPR